MLIVILAIGVANVVFALDSIPAIFGLTTDPYIVFAANAFALMGLRQLYFLVASLLRRLHYLDVGLCVILCFIGVKLFLEALRSTGVPVPTVGIAFALGVIVLTLAGTVLAGALRRSGDREH
jgi:tellurite resistance protein TerC